MDLLRKINIIVVITTCVLLQAQGADKYTDEKRPYEFGFTIDGQQHRHEKKDKNGIIMGEFGFITADNVYHVTVYATDENGRFKIISMKNIHLKSQSTAQRQGHSLQLPNIQNAVASSQSPTQKPENMYKSISIEPPAKSCSHCSLPTTSTIPPASAVPTVNSGGIGGKKSDIPNNQVSTYNVQQNNADSQYPQQGDFENFPNQQLNHQNIGNQQTPDAQNSYTYKNNQQTQGASGNFLPHSQQTPVQTQSAIATQGAPPQLTTGQQNRFDATQGQQHGFGVPQGQQNGFGVPQGQQNGFGVQQREQNTFGSPQGNQNGFGAPQIAAQGLGLGTPKGSSYSNILNNQNSKTPASFNQASGEQLGTLDEQMSNNASGSTNEGINSINAGQTATGIVSGSRSPKLYNVKQDQFSNGLRPGEQARFGQASGNKIRPEDGQSNNEKPTLTYAQMQIVDKNTDIHSKRPGEKDGLPNGLTENDMVHLLYTFNYTLGFQAHFEEGYSNGVKQGYYYVTGRNGVRTRIDYIADDKGFRPKISQEVLDLLSDDVPKPETEKDEKYGLKGYEFKWLYYPLESKAR